MATITPLTLRELKDETIVALQEGRVVLLPRVVLDQVGPHPHGPIRALEEELRAGGGNGGVLAVYLGEQSTIAVFSPAALDQTGLDANHIGNTLRQIGRDGATTPLDRALLENRYPLPGTHLEVLGIDGRFA